MITYVKCLRISPIKGSVASKDPRSGRILPSSKMLENTFGVTNEGPFLDAGTL